MEKLRVKPQKWEKLTNKQQKLKSLQTSNMNGKTDKQTTTQKNIRNKNQKKITDKLYT